MFLAFLNAYSKISINAPSCLEMVSLVAGKPGQGRSILRCPSCLGWNCKFRVIKEGTREKWTFEQNHYTSGDCVCVCVCVCMCVYRDVCMRERQGERD